MRTETIKRTVYTAEEVFSGDYEEVKDKVLEKHWDFNVDHDWASDDEALLTPTDPWFKKRRIKNTSTDGIVFRWDKMYFDLDRGSYIQFTDVVVQDDEVFMKMLRIPKNLRDSLDYTFFQSSVRHSSGPSLEINRYEEGDHPCWREGTKYNWAGFTKKQQDIIDRAIEIWDEILHDAWTRLRDQYEYLTSEEAINEYEFYEDGNIV